MITREKLLRRMIRLSSLNGWSVAILGGISMLFSLLMGSWFGSIVCLAVTASGVMELKGRGLLEKDIPRAGVWLFASQLWLLLVIVGYCGYQLLSFDPSNMLKDLPLAEQQALQALVESNEQMIAGMYRACYISIIIASVLYQGGLCLYYKSRARKLDGLVKS